jgi:hypothetical protein
MLLDDAFYQDKVVKKREREEGEREYKYIQETRVPTLERSKISPTDDEDE